MGKKRLNLSQTLPDEYKSDVKPRREKREEIPKIGGKKVASCGSLGEQKDKEHLM